MTELTVLFHKHYSDKPEEEGKEDVSANFFALAMEVGFELGNQLAMQMALDPAILTPGEYLSLKAHELGRQRAEQEKEGE